MNKKAYIAPLTRVHGLLCLKSYGLGTGSTEVDDPEDILVRGEKNWSDESTSSPTQKNLWDDEW